MSFKAIRRFAAIAGFAVATLAGGIQAGTADDWPNQQITFVVALGPGGSADRTARLVAQRMQDELGVPIRVRELTLSVEDVDAFLTDLG